MPNVSKKGKAMPESPIRKLVPYAELAQKEGKRIYHLNIGQPDIPTPEEALHAIRTVDVPVVAYSHSAGNRSLRERLKAYYGKHQIGVDVDDILVTTGGSEALVFAMGSLTDPGDEIIVPEPFYANYYSFSTQSAATVVPIISSIDTGFALPPISEFERRITPRTKAILICNPGNPTGYVYTKSEIRQLAELVIKYDLFLISDEVYREFVYDGTDHYSVLQEEALEQHAIVVDSFSKRYSMCGARLGCLVSRNEEVLQTAMKFAQARLSPPYFAQVASEAALSAPDTYLKEVIKQYESRRNTLIEALKQISGLRVSHPKGAFYCIVELPVPNAEDFAKWLLSDFSLNNETVMVAPANGFYSSPKVGDNQIRIAYVLQESYLKRAVNIIREGLKQYISKQSSVLV